MNITSEFLDELLAKAKENERLRINYDMRTSAADQSQRMLNAILPGSVIPVHRHTQSTETVCVLRGRCIQHLYNENCVEVGQVSMEANGYCMAMSVEKAQWHNLEVLEPTVIFEAKDKPYGNDGSEIWMDSDMSSLKGEDDVSENIESTFSNCLGDLKKNIEYLIGMERQSGSMEVISSLYVARMLNMPIEEVETAMKELGLI